MTFLVNRFKPGWTGLWATFWATLLLPAGRGLLSNAPRGETGIRAVLGTPEQ